MCGMALLGVLTFNNSSVVEILRTDCSGWRIEVQALFKDGFYQSERSQLIYNENDPILREIWAQGYTRYVEDIVLNKVLLINDETKCVKEIELYHFNSCIASLRFKRGSNSAGDIHCWIKEADGSAEKFRNLIKFSNNKKGTVVKSK